MPTPQVAANLAALQAIASGNAPTEPDSTELQAQIAIDKSKAVVGRLKKMYNDPAQIFKSWRRETASFPIDDLTRDAYWNTYDDLYPGTRDQARQNLRNEIDDNLRFRFTDSQREFYLRDEVPKLPSWAISEYGPILEQFSAKISQQNAFKAESVYQADLEQRLKRLDFDGLDPDVSRSQHVLDILSLEKLNLLDVAANQQGRLGVADQAGNFRPAFAISKRADVLDADGYGEPVVDEQLLIARLAPDLIDRAVSRNLTNSRREIAEQDRVIQMTTFKNLEAGKIPRESWGKAFSVMPDFNTEESFQAGLRGLVDSGQVKDEASLLEVIHGIAQEFGGTDAKTTA